MDIGAERYQVVRAGFWWRVKVGDGQQTVGRCYTETEAQRLAAALLTAFRDGEYVGQTMMPATETPTYEPDNPPRLRKPEESVEEYRAAMGWGNKTPND